MTSYLIAGPGEEPVSLGEAKVFARVDGSDEDALVGALIAAARLHVESITGRALVTQTWRLVLSCVSGLVVPLPVVPAIALVDAPDGAVLQGDSVLLAATVDELTVDHRRLWRRSGCAGRSEAGGAGAGRLLVRASRQRNDGAGRLRAADRELPAGAAMSETRIPPLGTLTDRVQLQSKMMSDEPEGGEVAMYATLATVWARVRQLSARAAYADDARGQSISHSVVLRFRTDLKPGDRIVYRGRYLEIAGLADINGRRAYLSCQCSERAVTG